MPQWGWPFGPGAHAGSHVWQVLLAPHGCSGKGAHWEMSPMSSFQSQTAKSSSQEHCGYSSLGAGPFGFSMPGTWERPGGKCSGHNRPFHQVHPGVCNKDPNRLRQRQRPCGTSSLSTMVFPKKYSPIRDTILRVSWWLTSVSWWECKKYGPVCIICRPMVNVKDSIPLWTICLGHYPRKRSHSGRLTLEHWSMRTTALEIRPWGSAPTTSCLIDNLAFQLMWHLVWLHAPSQSQTPPNLLRS